MTLFLDWSVTIGFALVVFGIGLALVRLALGPSLPDRVVALDMMTVAIVAFCGLAAVLSGDTAFLDVALVLALVGFLATVALARFAERAVIREEDRDEDDETVGRKVWTARNKDNGDAASPSPPRSEGEAGT